MSGNGDVGQGNSVANLKGAVDRSSSSRIGALGVSMFERRPTFGESIGRRDCVAQQRTGSFRSRGAECRSHSFILAASRAPDSFGTVLHFEFAGVICRQRNHRKDSRTGQHAHDKTQLQSACPRLARVPGSLPMAQRGYR